jgi:hypothetical protein
MSRNEQTWANVSRTEQMWAEVSKYERASIRTRAFSNILRCPIWCIALRIWWHKRNFGPTPFSNFSRYVVRINIYFSNSTYILNTVTSVSLYRYAYNPGKCFKPSVVLVEACFRRRCRHCRRCSHLPVTSQIYSFPLNMAHRRAAYTIRNVFEFFPFSGHACSKVPIPRCDQLKGRPHTLTAIDRGMNRTQDQDHSPYSPISPCSTD